MKTQPRKLRVGIDMDGVVDDFNSSFQKEITAELGIILPHTYPVWDWPQHHGLTESQVARVWNRIRHHNACENWWFTLDPLPDTYLLGPASTEHELFFITSRVATPGLSIRQQTAQWLTTHHGIIAPHVYVSHEKGETAQELNLDYFIDDKPEHIEDVAGVGVMSYVCDAEYNRGKLSPKPVSGHIYIGRVQDLNEFLRRIK
jgi:uncharacterized HAD superfamily protein